MKISKIHVKTYRFFYKLQNVLVRSELLSSETMSVCESPGAIRSSVIFGCFRKIKTNEI